MPWHQHPTEDLPAIRVARRPLRRVPTPAVVLLANVLLTTATVETLHVLGWA